MKEKLKNYFECKEEKDIFLKIAEWSKEKMSVEICGFIGFSNENYTLKLCKNIAEDPKKYFAIDPLDFLTFKEENKIAYVFHSHVSGDEEPSEFDILMSENCCIPFMIYSLNTEMFKVYLPKNDDSSEEVVNKILQHI